MNRAPVRRGTRSWRPSLPRRSACAGPVAASSRSRWMAGLPIRRRRPAGSRQTRKHSPPSA